MVTGYGMRGTTPQWASCARFAACDFPVTPGLPSGELLPASRQKLEAPLPLGGLGNEQLAAALGMSNELETTACGALIHKAKICRLQFP